VNVIGERVAPGRAPPGRIRHFGWRSLAETVDIFSTFDILYHASEFSIGLGKEIGLSFPRSFPLYLAAGRPILFHGPDGGAVPSYLRANAAGLVVPDDHAAAIYNAICKLIDDPPSIAASAQPQRQPFCGVLR
jgi:glycosyltransferase involved in cell wall biosynthesis